MELKPEQIAKMQSGRKSSPTRSTVNHTVLCSNGLYLIARLTRKTAILAFCTECLGFEDHPDNCTSRFCPLYPFRGKTLRSKTGNLTKEQARELVKAQ
jgi:hypothetical protein